MSTPKPIVAIERRITHSDILNAIVTLGPISAEGVASALEISLVVVLIAILNEPQVRFDDCGYLYITERVDDEPAMGGTISIEVVP